MDPGQDLQALQGAWQQVAFEQDGVDEPPDSHGATNSITTITGHRYTVRTVEGDLILEGSFVLDGSTTPRGITWTDDSGPHGHRSLECSYLLDGDRFVFVGAHDGGPRPVEFRTRVGQTMRTFVRVR